MTRCPCSSGTATVPGCHRPRSRCRHRGPGPRPGPDGGTDPLVPGQQGGGHIYLGVLVAAVGLSRADIRVPAGIGPHHCWLTMVSPPTVMSCPVRPEAPVRPGESVLTRTAPPLGDLRAVGVKLSLWAPRRLPAETKRSDGWNSCYRCGQLVQTLTVRGVVLGVGTDGYSS